jgi:hypothetical protein
MPDRMQAGGGLIPGTPGGPITGAPVGDIVGQGYQANPFAFNAPMTQQRAYSTALRQYAPTQTNYAPGRSNYPVLHPAKPVQMSPHLSQRAPLDPDYIKAYKEAAFDPRAQQAGFQLPQMDVEKVWQLTPTSPLFKPGYEHNRYITQYVDEMRAKREEDAMLAQMSEQDRNNYLWQRDYPSHTGWGD